MKVLYKTVMFLTLLIFCVGSVCATDPDPTDPIIKKLAEDNAQLNIKVYNQSIEIKQLKDNNTQLDKRVKTLEDSNKVLTDKVQALEDSNKVLTDKVQALEDSNKVLTDSNKVLTDKVQALEYSKLTQSNRIKSLEIDIKNLEDSNKQLVDSNKALNVKIDNQSVIINSLKTDNEALNAKLDLQLIEIKQLNADKDKLNAEIKENYKKLLESPKKEDYEQLKKDIINKDNKIKELNTKINILNNILNINKKDVYNSLKGLSSTNIQNIKCGKYTFKLDDYLKIPLIKDGKKNVLKFKKENGRLPNYVTIAGYDVPKNVYKKLYNIK